MAKVELVLIKEDLLGVSFPFDRGHVAAIKGLASRKWNPSKTRWEVHLAHLTELMEIFRLGEAEVPPEMLALHRERWAQPKAARVRLGAVAGKLEGAVLPLAELDEAASYPIPGAKFSPKFKSGQWDGRKHLFSRRTLAFPVGLWPRLREILEGQGFQIEAEGTDRPETIGKRGGKKTGNAALRAEAPPTALRDYQRKALMQAMRAGRGVIQIPTGGGKTLLAAHLIHAIDRPTMFFVHTRELLYQTVAVFERELGIEVGVLGDGRAMLRPLTVATIQTAMRALDEAPAARSTRRKPGRAAEEPDDEPGDEAALELDEATRHQVREAIEQAGVVVFDECHHLPADSFYKIALQTRSALWRFGLSATPWREDGQDLLLEAALGPAISVTDFSELIRLGYLVAPRIEFAAPQAPRIAQGRVRLSYADVYAMAIVENQDRNRAIAARARGWAGEGLSVLVLVNQTAHGEALAGLLPEARFVHGALDTGFRRQCLDDLERKLHPILIATTLADEGLDVPTLDAVILAGGGKSATRVYQRIGRALRPAPGKSEARVLDFLDDLPWLRDHSAERLRLYRQEASFQIELPAGPRGAAASRPRRPSR